MKKIRIGVAGLGGIAQKAYLPVLTRTDNWVLGAVRRFFAESGKSPSGL